MNKHDFYKEIMSEYSFDTEKIRSNAKKGKYARQKITPFTIGLTAAVAAVTVTLGTVAMTNLGDRNGVDLVGTNPSLSALSSSERVQNAIEQQNKNRDSEELLDVMVTFNSPLSPKRAEAVIAAHTDGSVPVKTVYLADGSRISGSEQVAAVFGGSSEISGVCIECAGSVMALLQNDRDVFLVELMSESDLNTVAPINPEDVDTLEVTIPEYVPPVELPDDIPDTQEGGATVTAPDETQEAPETVEVISPETEEVLPETTENGTTEPQPETTDIPETAEAPETEQPAATDDAHETSDTPETEQPEPPVTPTAPELPEGVVLPTAPESFRYETENVGAESAYFLSEYTIFARTDSGFALYDYFNGKESLVDEAECDSPRVHWVAEKGGKLIVSANDENGMRNRMWLVDAGSQTIIELNAKDTVMDGTMTDVGYNADCRKMAMVVKEYGVYYTFILTLDENNSLEYVNYVFETEAKTELLACTDSSVYVAVTDGSLSQVYRADIATAEKTLLKTYTGAPKFSHNLAFTHGITAPSDSALSGSVEIFDPATESFISAAGVGSSAVFGASRHNVCIDGSYYAVVNGGISPTGGINAIAPVDYKNSFSTRYAAHADSGYIVITDSVYSSENKSGVLEFGHITSSNDGDFRAVLDGAIGIGNALALDKCRESGIYTPEALTQSMSVYYTKNAVQQLRELCAISELGALSYSGGGLKAICAKDTELVISYEGSEAATGILYIRAGSFGGKTAYRTVKVTFLNENGFWKLDTIISK